MPKAKDTEYRDRTATAERTEYRDRTATAERTEYRDRTATAERTEHQDTTATAEKAEYADEKAEHKTQYPAENRDNSYLAANQHMVKFSDELRGINEQAALSFDRRKNPAEYDLKEKEEMLEAVTEAFNATSWNSANERRLAADDIAQNLYHPMYPRMEIAEAAVQHKLPEEFIQELKQEKIEYFETKQDEAGAEALQLTVAANSSAYASAASIWFHSVPKEKGSSRLTSGSKSSSRLRSMGKQRFCKGEPGPRVPAYYSEPLSR